MVRFVLALAFSSNAWLMVRNRLRGWEFAGGKVKEGETSENAAVREFIEETGFTFVSCRSFIFKDGEVFTGEIGNRVGPITDPDIEEWEWVEELPANLGFPRQECQEIVERARRLQQD
jgi:8-oxo-dGTP diphosphatase